MLHQSRVAHFYWLKTGLRDLINVKESRANKGFLVVSLAHLITITMTTFSEIQIWNICFISILLFSFIANRSKKRLTLLALIDWYELYYLQICLFSSIASWHKNSDHFVTLFKKLLKNCSKMSVFANLRYLEYPCSCWRWVDW